MTIVTIILMAVIVVQALFILKYQRQILDICRQLSFLEKKDSNMIITGDMNIGHLGRLRDALNAYIIKQRKRYKKYLDKEKTMADTYTSLSHDIRTPLTSLDGYFQLLADSDKEEQKRYIMIIQDRIISLKDMLEELFTFAKLKNDSYEFELSKCSVSKIVKDTVFSYYDEWTNKEIKPEIDICDKILYVNGNEQAIRRTLQNIIKNGLDHGKKDIVISLYQEEDNAVLTVKNYVENTKDIDVSQVFEQFYKADIARAKQSNGLGLSIAKEFVVRMNGNITAKTEEHEFIIRIELPILHEL